MQPSLTSAIQNCRKILRVIIIIQDIIIQVKYQFVGDTFPPSLIQVNDAQSHPPNRGGPPGARRPELVKMVWNSGGKLIQWIGCSQKRKQIGQGTFMRRMISFLQDVTVDLLY